MLAVLAIDAYIYRRCLRRLRSSAWAGAYLIVSALLMTAAVAAVVMPKRGGDLSTLLMVMWLLFTFLSASVPKALFFIVDMIASLPRLWHRRRLKWLSAAGAVASAALFAAMWWGALVNRFNVDVVEVPVAVSDLPAEFEGYRIVQLSDLHVGTYGGDTAFVAEVVDRVNALDADMVMFTGDIVNRETAELPPFVSTLARLKARDGVVAVLGNHDYGDYRDWPSDEAKAADHEWLRSLFSQMGWRLLLNETVMLRRGADSLAVIGVENIGDPPFHTYGDLSEAYPTPADSVTKILLSHTPAHWTTDIADNPVNNIALTLSGHTHAMQIRVGGLSPCVWRYKTWGGLYADSLGRDLYVNIGLGTVGMPMRLGATPEVTVLTLHRKRGPSDPVD
jgi:hypothetical protein